MRKKHKLVNKIIQHLDKAGIPRWFHHFGPKKFVTAQLVLGLAVREAYRLSYRLAARFLDEYYDVKMHWTTLQKAASRLPVWLWHKLLRATGLMISMCAAVDSTGFSRTNPSYHYLRRIDGRMPSTPVKTSIMVDVDTRKILSARVRVHPAHDVRDVHSLIRQSKAKPYVLLMDKGYDSEKLHAWLDSQGMWSVAPVRKGCRRGWHRKQLQKAFPRGEYGYRNIVEAVYKSLKARFGSHVRGRQARTIRAEMYIRFILHNIRSLQKILFLQTRFKQYLLKHRRPIDLHETITLSGRDGNFACSHGTAGPHDTPCRV